MSYDFSFGSINLVPSHIILNHLYMAPFLFQPFQCIFGWAREGWKWERAGVASPGRVAWQGNLR